MGVFLFYLCAFIPVAVGAFIWYHDDEVVWQEWLIGVAVAFATAGIMHWAALMGMTSDVETWSGKIHKATFYPKWVEEYEVTDYCTGTDSDGNSYTYACGSHTEYTTHREYWDAVVDFGRAEETYRIEESFWREISANFNNKTTETPWKYGFYSGDKNVYTAYNKTGYVYPATTTRRFENRVKAAPSLFSFSEVPEGTKVYEWPGEEQPTFGSHRLLGTAMNLFDILEFDRMNTRLGPLKKVNVIMVGFVNEDSEYGHMQEAKWIGGKKNDLVIAFGGMSRKNPATWAHVFGWTESDLCKRNLETLFVENPASASLLPAIEAEVLARYEIKDWDKFDYITVEPPGWSYLVFFGVLLVTQGGLYCFFHANDLGAAKRWSRNRFGRRHYRR